MSLAQRLVGGFLGVACCTMAGYSFGFDGGLEAKEAISPRLTNCLEALQENQHAAAENSRLLLKAACGKFCGDLGLRPRWVLVSSRSPETFDCRCGGDL